MSDLRNIEDPTVAVLLDRFTRFEKDAVSRLDALHRRLETIEGTHSMIANRAKGGYMVILGLGTVASYFMGAFEHIIKIFTKGS